MGIIKLIQNYNALGHKEFMRKFKEGVNSASPMQQVEAQITFTRITLLGIGCGFFVSVLNAKNLWWLAIIMGAAFGNTFVGYIGLKQKKDLLKRFEQPVEVTEELKGGIINNV